jgi:hypothetical protein
VTEGQRQKGDGRETESRDMRKRVEGKSQRQKTEGKR